MLGKRLPLSGIEVRNGQACIPLNFKEGLYNYNGVTVIVCPQFPAERGTSPNEVFPVDGLVPHIHFPEVSGSDYYHASSNHTSCYLGLLKIQRLYLFQ